MAGELAPQSDALSEVLEQIPNPTIGLPDEVFNFVRAVSPLINVDLMVVDREKGVLLSWRDDDWGVGWHVPGGVIRFKETISFRLTEVARLEVGARLKFEETPTAISQFFGSRGHFISLLFECSIVDGPPGPMMEDARKPKPGDLAWFSAPPDARYRSHEGYIARLPPFLPEHPLDMESCFTCVERGSGDVSGASNDG